MWFYRLASCSRSEHLDCWSDLADWVHLVLHDLTSLLLPPQVPTSTRASQRPSLGQLLRSCPVLLQLMVLQKLMRARGWPTPSQVRKLGLTLLGRAPLLQKAVQLPQRSLLGMLHRRSLRPAPRQNSEPLAPSLLTTMCLHPLYLCAEDS